MGPHMEAPLEGRGAGFQPGVRSDNGIRTMLPAGSLDLGALASVQDAWKAAYAPHLEHLPTQETARLLYEVWHLPLPSLTCASARLHVLCLRSNIFNGVLTNFQGL